MGLKEVGIMVEYRENMGRGGRGIVVFGARANAPALNMPAGNGPGKLRSHAHSPDGLI